MKIYIWTQQKIQLKIRGLKMNKVYKQTIRDTIELLELIVSATDEIITNEDKKKGVELKIEYKKRLSDIKK